MFDIQQEKINTAGAYVCMHGLYLFTIGIRPHQGRIPIVRIGGHREGHETGWQCAVREVFEETGLRIQPFSPPLTYWYDWDHLEAEPEYLAWYAQNDPEPAPFLVIAHAQEQRTTLSLMYFAHTDGVPVPSAEVKGLLFLTAAEIHQLCQQPTTLKAFLNRGGQAMLSGDFDLDSLLEPFAQLRLLSNLLRRQDAASLDFAQGFIP